MYSNMTGGRVQEGVQPVRHLPGAYLGLPRPQNGGLPQETQTNCSFHNNQFLRIRQLDPSLIISGKSNKFRGSDGQVFYRVEKRFMILRFLQFIGVLYYRVVSLIQQHRQKPLNIGFCTFQMIVVHPVWAACIV